MVRNKFYFAFVVGILLSLIAGASLAATEDLPYSGGTLTITYPDDYSSCEPADTIEVSGINPDNPITIFFQQVDPATGSIFNLGSVTTNSDGEWPFPYPDISDGTTSFVVSVRDEVAGKMLKGFKWDVICEEPPEEFQACSPGYFRNHQEERWAPTGISPNADFDATFGTNLFTPDIALGEAIALGGSGVNRLARFGTAALLSAAHPDINFPYSEAEVIAFVQAGNANALAAAIEDFDCPL
ncbi:MAG: hypothetical protein IBX69_12890 [Anaerolineales bacterium]|nr:hypothetical protein [Anaerolineales bacterium]